jgi:hypothetical protein
MGSEQAPQALLEAVYELAQKDPSCTFVILGNNLNVKELPGITYLK